MNPEGAPTDPDTHELNSFRQGFLQLWLWLIEGNYNLKAGNLAEGVVHCGFNAPHQRHCRTVSEGQHYNSRDKK